MLICECAINYTSLPSFMNTSILALFFYCVKVDIHKKSHIEAVVLFMDEVVYFFFLAVHSESLFMDVIVVIFFIEVLLTLLLHKLR